MKRTDRPLLKTPRRRRLRVSERDVEKYGAIQAGRLARMYLDARYLMNTPELQDVGRLVQTVLRAPLDKVHFAKVILSQERSVLEVIAGHLARLAPPPRRALSTIAPANGAEVIDLAARRGVLR